jgi:hypothetical protein
LSLLYSMIDSHYPISAPEQHKLIRDKAKNYSYDIGFYGAEDPRFRFESPYLIAKLPSLYGKYSGVIFFSLFQLEGNVGNLIKTLLSHNLVCLFACQNLLIRGPNEYDDNALMIISATTSLHNQGLVLSGFFCNFDTDK